MTTTTCQRESPLDHIGTVSAYFLAVDSTPSPWRINLVQNESSMQLADRFGKGFGPWYLIVGTVMVTVISATPTYIDSSPVKGALGFVGLSTGPIANVCQPGDRMVALGFSMHN